MIKLMIEDFGYDDSSISMSQNDYNEVIKWLKRNGFKLGITDYSYVKDMGDGVEIIVDDLDDHFVIEISGTDGTLYNKVPVYNRDQFFDIVNNYYEYTNTDSEFDQYSDEYDFYDDGEDYYDNKYDYDFGDNDDRYGDVGYSRRLF